MQKTVIGGASLCLLVLAMACPLIGQIGGSGSIQGVVSDQSGAIIPGATVGAKNIATGVKTTRSTTDAGFYILSPLPAGRYVVTISAPGFQTLNQENLVVDALGSVGFNAILKIGATGDQVTVTDTPPALNTSDSSMSQTIRNEVYTALPLAVGAGGSANNIARDPTNFVTLMPGVTNFGQQSAGSVSGAQSHSQEVYVEGIALTNPVLQGETRSIAIGVSIEAIDQFQLESAGMPAMYGGQGATNFVLKSGTNQFHGTGYDYFRNTVLDARNFFAATRPPEHQNEFGATFGGPVKKNRVFFFSAYDGFRKHTMAQPSFFSLPTLRERNGDFGEFPTVIYDPRTTNCASGPCTRQAFPNNIIPADRISPASKYFASFLFPLTNPGIQSNYQASVPIGFNNNNTTNKVDVNLSDAHRFYAMYSHGSKKMTTPYSLSVMPLPYADGRLIYEIMTTAQVRHTWVARPNVLNQISYGFSRFWVPIRNTTIDGQYPIKAGLKGLPPGEADSAFPTIAFSGPNAPSQWRGANSPAFDEAANTFTLQDNVQWTHGKHSLTVGAQIQWLQANEKPQTYGTTASWNFSNTQTAGFGPTGTLLTATSNPYASYLLGAVSSASIVDAWVSSVGGRIRPWAWWAQDNFKVSPRLTVNFGVRHDLFTPRVEVRDRMSWLNPTTPNPAVGGFPGALQFAGYGPNSCQCRNNFSMYYRAFGPRIGFAYSVTRTTVVRGGYMMTYTHKGAGGGYSQGSTGTGLLGFVARPSFASLDNGISPAFNWDAGVPPYQKAPFFDSTLNTGFNTTTAQGGSVTYGNPRESGRPAMYQNWNFGIQHAITPTLTLDVSYVGSNGHYLAGGARGIWSNQIVPKYLALGNLLSSSATPANLAAAQRIFPEVSLPYANFAGSIAQMLRPFPQYSGITDVWGNVGNVKFNSLQVIGRKTISSGLIVNFNYTFSKTFDDYLGNRSGYFSDKAQGIDPTHVLNVMFAYRVPFGRGHRFAGSNAIARAVASDWQLSGVTTYRSGTGFGSIGAACNLPNAGGCYADYNAAFSGPVRINGDYGSGDLLSTNAPAFLDKNAFVSPAAFEYGNTPRTLVSRLHNPSRYNQDLSLRREFAIRERVTFRLQADAINALNLVNFSGPNATITSANFGKITSQANLPRVVQFTARVSF
jgi:hypothetical protein